MLSHFCDWLESTWDHPCDEYYKNLFEKEKKRSATKSKEMNDERKKKERADVAKLICSHLTSKNISFTIIN